MGDTPLRIPGNTQGNRWTCRTASAAAALAVSLSVPLVGCEPDQPAQAPVSSVGLPRWDARAQQIFDDNIDAAAVGLSMEGPSPRSDAYLRERSQTADVVARLRVQTVTLDSAGDHQTYHLGLQVGVPTLTEAKVPDRSFEIAIKSASPAFAVARSIDAGLRGKTFVGFLKRYSGDDGGEPSLHWHLAADTAEVAAAIKEAVILGEVSRK